MADITDLENTITQSIVGFVYPTGTSNPSIAGVTVTVAPGWPVRNKLDDSLIAGNALISVFADEKETSGPIFERIEQALDQQPQTIFATVLSDTITITGTVALPQAIVTIVDGQTYPYALQAGDTLNSIATSIAALLPSAVAVGNVITVSGFYLLETRVSTAYSSTLDLGRQKRAVMISCWCPTPQIRTTLGSAIIVYFKANYRILLPDDYWANVFYRHTREMDILEKQNIFRRDLIFDFLYATTSETDYMSLVWPVDNNMINGV